MIDCCSSYAQPITCDPCTSGLLLTRSFCALACLCNAPQFYLLICVLVFDAGTPEYVAPEVLAQSNYDGKAADVWSCGVVLYTLLTGAFPFRDPQEQGLNPVVLLQRVFPRILAGSFEMPPGLSPDCQSVLKAMLTVDPAQRIPAIQLLQHPWLKKFDAATELAHLQKTSKKPMAENWVMQTDTQILNLSQLAAANPQDAPASPEAALPY